MQRLNNKNYTPVNEPPFKYNKNNTPGGLVFLIVSHTWTLPTLTCNYARLRNGTPVTLVRRDPPCNTCPCGNKEGQPGDGVRGVD